MSIKYIMVKIHMSLGYTKNIESEKYIDDVKNSVTDRLLKVDLNCNLLFVLKSRLSHAI